MNFDMTTQRLNTYSMKWDVQQHQLPMGLADMDFKTADEIVEAIETRVKHGIFGYTVVPDEWFIAYQQWWLKRYQFRIEKEWLIFCTGVVPAISSIIRKLTTPAERVVVLTPVYNIFFNSIVNNGRVVVECPLLYQDEVYEINWQSLTQELSHPQTTMMILCNPHNPIGTIWDYSTLLRIGELCAQHHVTIISDEIHSDLTAPGKHTLPFASVSDLCAQISVTCIAPTKTFNLAGLQTAAVLVSNPALRNKISRGMNTDEIAEPNVFAIEATIAAYQKGELWLDELIAVIDRNKKRVSDFLEQRIPLVKMVPSQATYLCWIDCQKITQDSSMLKNIIQEETGLILNAGKEYGESGKSFLRMNVAVSKQRLEDGLQRLEKGIHAYIDYQSTR